MVHGGGRVGVRLTEQQQVEGDVGAQLRQGPRVTAGSRRTRDRVDPPERSLAAGVRAADPEAAGAVVTDRDPGVPLPRRASPPGAGVDVLHHLPALLATERPLPQRRPRRSGLLTRIREHRVAHLLPCLRRHFGRVEFTHQRTPLAERDRAGRDRFLDRDRDRLRRHPERDPTVPRPGRTTEGGDCRVDDAGAGLVQQHPCRLAMPRRQPALVDLFVLHRQVRSRLELRQFPGGIRGLHIKLVIRL